MNCLEYALQYLEHGICVLPVRPLEKRPYMSNWHKYTDIKPSQDDVKLWYKSLSGAGVGAVTGRISGIIVLDIDNRFVGNVSEIMEKYPTNRVARSGSGGYHLYYKYPDTDRRIPNAVNIIKGVDLRADGGFIVLPPTIHSSGVQYKWEKEGELGEFPKELLDKERTTEEFGGNKWLSETLSGVSQGGRNDAASKLAGYFFGKGLNYDVVERLLLDWNKKNDPPLKVDEIITTIKSIHRYNQNASSKTTDVQVYSPVDTTKQMAFMNLKGYFNKYGGEGVLWLIDDWLPMDSIAFLVSPPESYKTWLLLDLAVSVASGMPFLGKFTVNKQGAVLLIQQEDSHTGIMERLSVIIQSRLNLHGHFENGEWDMPVLPELPMYIHPDRALKFDNKSIMDSLEETIAKIRPVVILIDPLYSAANTDNYMANTAEQMLRLKTFRDKYGCSIVVAHHSKKNIDPNSTAREDAWGSQFLNAFLEAGWQIRRGNKLEQNEIVVRRHSKTKGNQPSVILKFDICTHDEIKYEVSVDDCAVRGAQLSKPLEDIVLLLSAAKKPISQIEMSERLNKNRSTISRQIQKLKDSNVIAVDKDGKYHITEEGINE